MKVKKPAPTPFPEEASVRFLEPVGDSLQRIEDKLAEQCGSFDPSVSACVGYVAATQGKRMRPALVFYSASAAADGPIDGANDELLKAGLIVELVHIATLVHDDILDGATFRRNRLTASAKWGPEISVLLGDCLFAHALKLASEFKVPTVCRLVSDATNTVCSGEILQTQRRFDLKLSRSEYVKIIQMKTGALFGASCELGALLAGGATERQAALRDFGNLFGIAYQIYDDIVDLVGDEQAIGKSLGTDLQKGKLTLPLLLLLEQAAEGEHQLISSLLLNEHGNARSMLLDYVRAHRTITQSARVALDFTRQAAARMDGLGTGDGARLLRGMNDLLASKLEAFVGTER